LRFIDLFMLLIAALLFVIVMVSLTGALVPEPSHQQRLEVATDSLPIAIEGIRYALYLAVRGGTPPCRWQVVEGGLPRGLWLEGGSGRIGGIPLRPTNERMTVEVTDARGVSARRTLALEVRARRRGEILRTEGEVLSLPEAVTFVPYHFRLSPAGGRPPCTWRVREGPLPPGLELSPDGTVTGTLVMQSVDARLADPWRFCVEVEDSDGRKRTQSAVMSLRFIPRWSWTKTVEEAVAGAFKFVCGWVIAPLLAVSLSGLLLLAITGFPGGWAPPWDGLIRYLRRMW
jgi:hypothetical protein